VCGYALNSGSTPKEASLTSTRAAHSTELPYGNFSCPGATVLFACVGSRLYSSYLLSELSLQVKENLQIIFGVRIFPASGGAVVSLRLSISLPNQPWLFPLDARHHFL